MNVKRFSASGKLLLFGEYLVLRGTPAIVMPLSYRQTLTISENHTQNILWECFEKNTLWLSIEMSDSLKIIQTTDLEKARIVQQLLQLIRKQENLLSINHRSFHFEINFLKDFGFGTSSTFLSLLSQWSGVNPYFLLENSFGGSGFDIAAATATSPFVYQASGLSANSTRHTKPVSLAPQITDKLLFVYTGRKQQSRDEVHSFSSIQVSETQLMEMNAVVESVLKSGDIEQFENEMRKSEILMSGILKTTTVKENFFSDYPYAIKSLGAWGGDFILATFRDETEAQNYFREKGLQTFFTYSQLIWK